MKDSEVEIRIVLFTTQICMASSSQLRAGAQDFRTLLLFQDGPPGEDVAPSAGRSSSTCDVVFRLSVVPRTIFDDH